MKDDLVEADCYLLMKRGLYYRPENRGYTGRKDQAGRYPQTDAAPEHGIIAIHENDAPEFSPACYEDVKLQAKDERITAQAAEIARLREALEEIRTCTSEHGGAAKALKVINAALKPETDNG